MYSLYSSIYWFCSLVQLLLRLNKKQILRSLENRAGGWGVRASFWARLSCLTSSLLAAQTNIHLPDQEQINARCIKNSHTSKVKTKDKKKKAEICFVVETFFCHAPLPLFFTNLLVSLHRGFGVVWVCTEAVLEFKVWKKEKRAILLQTFAPASQTLAGHSARVTWRTHPLRCCAMEILFIYQHFFFLPEAHLPLRPAKTHRQKKKWK